MATSAAIWLSSYAALVSTIVAVKEVVDISQSFKEKRIAPFKEINSQINNINFSSSNEEIASIIDNINNIFDYDTDIIKKISYKESYVDFKIELIDTIELIQFNLINKISSKEDFLESKKNLSNICKKFTKENL